MAQTIDRRAARTRKALHEALISLIQRKGYEALTVQDIIDAADVGRSTFYAHYTGKEDLLRSGFERLRTLLADEQRNAAARRSNAGREHLAFSLALFEHACEYKDVYRALVGSRGSVIVTNEIRRILSDTVRKEFSAAPAHDDIPQEIRLRFVVDTFLAVLGASLGRRPSLPPDRMNAIFRRLVMGGLGLSDPAPAAPPAARPAKAAGSVAHRS